MTMKTDTSEPVSDPVARHMGHRVVRRREDLHLSRRRLASLLGLSTQDLRAREEGAERIDGKTLYDLSGLLGVPMAYFLEGLPSPRRPRRLEARLRVLQTRALNRAVDSLPTAERRAWVLDLLTEP